MTEIQASTVRKVLVLGGGSAGFMAAGAMKLMMPDLVVRVLRSPDIGVIGVGEGSRHPNDWRDPARQHCRW